MFNITIDFIVLMVAAVVGFAKGAHRRTGFIKFLPFFLLLILCVELAGQAMQYYNIRNTMMYNLSTTLQITYYIYFFREAIIGIDKKLLTHLLWIFPLVCLIDIFFIQGIHLFHTFSYTLGCVLMICLGITYFYRLFKSSEQVILLREPAFWISISILFLFICSLSLFSMSNFLSKLPWNVLVLIKKIVKLINAFAYLFFIIAFLCRSKNTPRS